MRGRRALYCVPVPGETQWAKSHYAAQSNPLAEQVATVPTESPARPTTKRILMDDDEVDEAAYTRQHPHDSVATHNQHHLDGAEGQTENPTQSTTAAANLLLANFPLPDSGRAVLVKVYDDSDSIKINDVVEIVGILSVDPTAAVDDVSSEDTFVALVYIG